MKKKFSFMIALAMFVNSGCIGAATIKGDGNIISAERNLSDFGQIQINVAGNVKVHIGSAPRVVIKTDANLMNYVETEISGGILQIKCKGECRYTKMEIEIYTQTLNGLYIHGSSDVETLQKIEADKFDLKISGSGSVKVAEMKTNSLNLSVAGSGSVKMDAVDCTEDISSSIAGSGDIYVKGSSKQLNIAIAGSGDFKGENLQVRSANVKISGSGDAKVWAEDELNVNIAGSGDVFYKGTPKLNLKTAGSGSVKSL
jgi:hypothetical protein